MNNIFKYINSYGDLTFEEKKVTEVDILIFSQISYLDFKDTVLEFEGIKLDDAWKKARKKNEALTNPAQKSAFKIVDVLNAKKRYRDLILKNYVYHLAEDTQFGAISIIVPNDYIYVSFEGTDNNISGWKEDFKLSYIYPTDSQRLAASYLNNTIKLNGSNVVVCGHSKGGNLALVGAMNTKFLKKTKIKQIYSFDGPGLKREEFNSLNYKLIRNKLINIIPNLSLIGVLLNQENVKVIKSRGIGISQHYVTTWVIDDDKLKQSIQDKLSKRLDESITEWLAKHNYKEREEIIEGIFSIFEMANVKNFDDINNLEIVYKIIKSSLELSKETRDVILTSIKLLATDFGVDIINDGKKEIEEFQENIQKFLKKGK